MLRTLIRVLAYPCCRTANVKRYFLRLLILCSVFVFVYIVIQNGSDGNKLTLRLKNTSLLFHLPQRWIEKLSPDLPYLQPQWKPNSAHLHQLLANLNLTQSQASSGLPLTLQGPELLSNESLCRTEDGSPIDVVFFVHTAPNHFKRREQLRRTFMAVERFRPFKVRRMFLLGQVQNASQQMALQEEHLRFGDLVQGHFLDAYHNLSHKGVMGFRWLAHHCPRVRLVVKLDDDFFFDTFKLLHRYFTFMMNRKKSIFCSLWKINTMPILRSGKWSVDQRLFMNKNRFPYNYCSGAVVMMTGDLMPSLFAAARVTPVFWIDDVYLFGILPLIASDTAFYDIGYSYNGVSLNWERSLKCLKEKGHNCTILASVAVGKHLDMMWSESEKLYNHSGKQWTLPAARV